MKRMLFCVAILAVSLPAFAQNGWSRAGAAAGNAPQSSQDAYNIGILQGAEQALLLENARGAKLDADRLEAENHWKTIVAADWQALGFSSDEATSIAAVYQLTNDQQAIIVRAQHQEFKVTVTDAMAACKNYNYQLADQLIVAAEIVIRNQSRKMSADSGANQPSKSISDHN